MKKAQLTGFANPALIAKAVIAVDNTALVRTADKLRLMTILAMPRPAWR